MNRRYMRLSWLGAQVVLLGACGKNSLQSGIEGSGVTTPPVAAAITTSGEVTALGSIVVNDIEYDLAGATITIDGLPARESDLAPGQVTVVEGELAEGSTRGIAKTVGVETPVAGRVSAIDPALRRLTILKQTIEIDAGTIIVDGVGGNPLGGLDVGRDVEVSGFADSTGVLHATRIAERKTTTPLLVTGRVANLDTSARTFSVNGQVVSYVTATLHGLQTPTEGAIVRVAGQHLDQGTLVADEVSLRSDGLPGEAGAAAALQGWVTRFGSLDDFDVDGRRVVAESLPADSVVRLDAFVSVRGALIADGVVQAKEVRAVLPGRIIGAVTIEGVGYGVSGLMTKEGAFILTIEGAPYGAHVLDSGPGQLKGSFTFTGRSATGTGVLIGEACALPSGGRFCGMETPVRIELTKTGTLIDDGSSGVIRVATQNGEEIWPLHLAYWGGRAGFDPSWYGYLPGLYELHQAEFILGSSVYMTVHSGGRLFFESGETGCVGNGSISLHLTQENANLYDMTLEIDGCNGSFSYLNRDFEGLAHIESVNPWAYDWSVLSMWLSTPAGATSPAAMTFWATYVE